MILFFVLSIFIINYNIFINYLKSIDLKMSQILSKKRLLVCV